MSARADPALVPLLAPSSRFLLLGTPSFLLQFRWLPDGVRNRWCVCVIEPAIVNGVMEGYVGYLLNINKHKLATTASELREEQLRHELALLSETTSVGLVRIDLSGHFLSANEAWYRICRVERGSVLDSWSDNLHPDDFDWVFKQWKQCVLSPCPPPCRALVGARDADLRTHRLSRPQLSRDARAVPGPLPLEVRRRVPRSGRPQQPRLGERDGLDRQRHGRDGPSPLGGEAPRSVQGARGARRALRARSRGTPQDRRRGEEAAGAPDRRHEPRDPQPGASSSSTLFPSSSLLPLELSPDSCFAPSCSQISAILQNADFTRSSLQTVRGRLGELKARDALPAELDDKLLHDLDEDIEALDAITECGMAQERIANDILGLAQIQLSKYSITPVVFNLAQSLRNSASLFLTVPLGDVTHDTD